MKRGVDDLALFGGHAEFDQTLLVGRPSTGDRTKLYERLDRALDNGRLTGGGMLVREFEDRIAHMAGTRHCIAVCNATAALEVIIRAQNLHGEIIIPSMTFIATAHAVRYMGATPVFADIDPVTGTIDPDHVETLITPHTTAIIGVHLWGQPCDVDRLADIAHRHNLTLIYDAAHGIGCSHGPTPIGGFGHAEVFSFNATKVVNSFEGGAIVTNDDDFALRVRQAHNFGFIAPGLIGGLGTNAKMSEASGAMGLTSLDVFDEVVAHNKAGYDLYRDLLAGLPGLTVHAYDPRHRNNFQYVVVKVDQDHAGLHRDVLLDVLRAENVYALMYFSPACHQLEPYRSEHPVTLPHTERLAEQVIALPTGPATTSSDIHRVCEIVRFAIEHSAEIAAQWQDNQPETAEQLVSSHGEA
ncbi:DegT/DnrJ/EryC1/StrS family aminotransferase [Kutzneria albida]|uniref:Aminotransferase n=1 Tax=Kutzneria albida DSM 43870 TaxID=1449976 RepID=W5WGE3_9PSEU|nr:DegT/DnrJ/EryC1/StrS family aminotransferase [Kutzneria albida]AHH99937.1 aminotransferase [Kutzneria albida DSM 43870]